MFKSPSSASVTNLSTSSQMSFITHGNGGCSGVGVHDTLRGPLLTGFQCSRIRDLTVSRCLTQARCRAESRFVLRCSFMLQKYVSSWSLDAQRVTRGGSEPKVLQPSYGGPKAATTTSGAETTLIFGQFSNAVLCTVGAVQAARPPAYGRKTASVASFVHPAKALPMIMGIDDEIVRLSNELHSKKAQ